MSRLRVTFVRALCGDCRGGGQGQRLTAQVEGRSVGGDGVVVSERLVPLDHSRWSVEVEVESELRIDLFASGPPAASARCTLRALRSRNLVIEVGELLVVVDVEGVDVANWSDPETVWVHRSGGSDHATATVSREVRVEVDPVIPPLVNEPPRRPGFADAISAGTRDFGSYPVGGSTGTNPSVIPLQIDGSRDYARLSWTSWWPAALSRPDRARRIEWRPSALAGGAEIEFVGPSSSRGRGSMVHVRGKRAGEVLFELVDMGHVVGQYRALIRPIVRIPYNVTILRHRRPDGSLGHPMISPHRLSGVLRQTSSVLRQAGVELTPAVTAPPDTTPTEVAGVHVGVTPLPESQVFDSSAGAIRALPWVLNIVVVHDYVRRTAFGEATHKPGPTASPLIDSGSPSTSWLPPSGVAPDDPAQEVRLQLQEASPPGNTDIHGLVLNSGALLGTRPGAAGGEYPQIEWVRTLAHEIGHVFTLAHRGPNALNVGAYDGQDHRIHSNLMFRRNTHFDIDIAQSKAIFACPIVDRCFREQHASVHAEVANHR